METVAPVEETETVGGIIRSFWESVFDAIGKTVMPLDGKFVNENLVLKPIPMDLPPDTCPLAPGPIALEISLNGRILAYALKPVCLITGKSRNKLKISWAVRSC